MPRSDTCCNDRIIRRAAIIVSGVSVKPLRVGIVGCGDIAQIMHLPILTDMPQFAIGAVCDLSPTVVNAVGDRYGVAERYTDATDLVARDDLDIVAVLTMDHYTVAAAAIDAGKHVFVEKPLTFNVQEAVDLVDRADRHGVLLMVGYMKCFDPGFEYGAAYMRAMTDVRKIHVQDLTGVFDAHEPLYDLIRATDLPTNAAASQRRRIQDSIIATLGTDADQHADLFRKLLMLGSHDFAVLRAAFGSPDAVMFSHLTKDWGLTALLDYGDTRTCVFEIGSWPKYPWFHEKLIAFGRDEIATIAFSPPFVKNAPTTVTVEKSDLGQYVENRVVVNYEEAFKREWVHFADIISHRSAPRTDGRGAVRDLELAVEMVRRLPDVVPANAASLLA
jgi:predicted dehydrogenase